MGNNIFFRYLKFLQVFFWSTDPVHQSADWTVTQKLFIFQENFSNKKCFLGHSTSIERIIFFSKFENFYKFFFGLRIQSASPRIGPLLGNYSFFRKIFQTKNVFLGHSTSIERIIFFSKFENLKTRL